MVWISAPGPVTVRPTRLTHATGAVRVDRTPVPGGRLREVVVMADRIKHMRTALHAALVKRRTPGSWNHILTQIGMFTYSGLTSTAAEARARSTRCGER